MTDSENTYVAMFGAALLAITARERTLDVHQKRVKANVLTEARSIAQAVLDEANKFKGKGK